MNLILSGFIVLYRCLARLKTLYFSSYWVKITFLKKQKNNLIIWGSGFQREGGEDEIEKST